MKPRILPAAAVFFFLLSAMAMALPMAAAAVIEHTFVVSQVGTTNNLCKETLVTVVNGQLPGPEIEVTEGDLVAVHVINKTPYNMTIHLHGHGVKQRLNCWADGVPMITHQCPIRPNHSFTCRFNVAGQVPHREVPLVIGSRTEEGYVLEVEAGKTYLLRLINAALISEYYIKIVGQKFTVVAADANYVKPYTTDIIAITPSETVETTVANQPSIANPPFPITLTRGTLQFLNGDRTSGDAPLVPEMSDLHDMVPTFYFHGNLTSPRTVPEHVDEQLFVTPFAGSICRSGYLSCKWSGMIESIIMVTMCAIQQLVIVSTIYSILRA